MRETIAQMKNCIMSFGRMDTKPMRPAAPSAVALTSKSAMNVEAIAEAPMPM